MKLIVGLGNPGTRYQKTRHNVGQWAVEEIKSKNLKQVKLHRTTIFMNESGIEVKKLVYDSKIKISDLLIAHDDLDLEPGVWKLQFNRSAAGHKGVQSVIDELGTQEFWRLRIGIGKPPAEKTANEFVVEKPTSQELKLIKQAIEEATPRVHEWMDKE
jgi:PTH1 family peptidyl-tRNA hydrolase